MNAGQVGAMPPQTPRTSTARVRFEEWLPRLVVAPSFLASLVFVYVFLAWNAYFSVSASRVMPNYRFVGLVHYHELWANDRWWVALRNLGIFGVLFIGLAIAVGLTLAILLDQRIRAEGALRSIYLYPMALSFIVTGTAWKWILNPTLGLEHLVQRLGFTSFTFDWLVNTDRAIYTIVIAAVWQSSGFAMALFLAGLRGIDESIIKAAQVDGATLPRTYWHIIIPTLRPVFFSTVMIMAQLAIKSFDLVIALTNRGPGYSSDLPASFMYTMAFERGQLGLGAASTTFMLMTIAALAIPYLYSETRGYRKNA